MTPTPSSNLTAPDRLRPDRLRPDRLRIGWVVDVQHDFMEPEGRLYVRHLSDPTDPGAAEVRDRIVQAVEWMHAACDLVVFTGDWHGFDDPEIDPESPNPALGTYPPHCMGRSDDPELRRGAELIAEISPTDPLVLEVDATGAQARALALEAHAARRSIFIRKTRFDVFAGNAGTEPFLDALATEAKAHLDFVVAGVARDVCVTQAVDGLQARGHAVTALHDATWGLGLEDEAATLARWAERGRVVSLADLQAEG
jgi:nicotinamidase-related amidase